MPGRLRLLGGVSSCLVALILLPHGATAEEDPVPVRNSKRNEFLPAAADGYIGWSENSKAKPRHYDAFVKPDGEPAFRINAGGTEGFMGGFDGTDVVYEQFDDGQLDIKFFDLVTMTRSDPPAGVNSRKQDWIPTRSGDYLLYGQFHGDHSRVFLFNLINSTKDVLADEDSKNRVLIPGQVNGDYAVFDRCAQTCDVVRHQISSGDNTTVPNPGGKPQYASSVHDSGTVFFLRSGFDCGLNVKLQRYNGVQTDTLVTYGDDRDSLRTYVAEIGSDLEVHFDRFNCNSGAFDTFKIVLPSG